MINNKGQSLLEVIVALAIFALISATMVSLSTGGFVSMNVGGEQTEAQALAGEGVEAVRAIRDRAWNELTFTTSSITTSSGQWIFSGENTIAQLGDYKRTITVETICRDVSNNITPCPGFYTDVQTKKITSQIDWPVRDTTNTVKQVSYLTNWDSLNWVQTDWSGGNGQSVWSDISKYDSDDDNIDFSEVGVVKLKNTTSTACGTEIWHFNTSTDFIYDSSKISVTSSLVKLIDQGGGFCSGTSTLCDTFFVSTTCSTQDGCFWTNVITYPDDRPSLNPVISHAVNSIDNWSSFSETAIKNGGEIYYQLSDDSGSTWQYWDGVGWTTAGDTDYNIASVINSNLYFFPTTTASILFRAFLESNGTQLVQLDNISISCAQVQDSTFDSSVDYSYDDTKIEFVSGKVQVKDLGTGGFCSGTSTLCDTFFVSTTCSTQDGCS
ncbi:MAG: prepilin-type N-terminal cleavage/methylation domain-containing protein, partial [Candidatus Magasanikiibacteriota bacterium]